MKLLEDLGHKMGLRLTHLAIDEVNEVNTRLQRVVDSHGLKKYLLNKRKLLTTAHDLQNLTMQAFEIALSRNGNQTAWDKVFSLAQKSDKASRAILTIKLREMLAPDSDTAFRLGGRHNILLLGYGVVAYICYRLPHLNMQDPMKVMIQLHIFYALIFLLPHNLLVILSLFSKSLTPLLVPNLMTNDVLEKAHAAGANFTEGPRLRNSDSLICKVINSVDNETELFPIGGTNDAPEEMCCGITLALMSDPVGCAQSRHRFERTAILNWLEQELVHPMTKLSLSPNELKRDFSLKLKIARYVSDRLITNEVTQYQNKSLVNLSIFQENPQSPVEKVLPEQDLIDSSKAMK